MMTNRKKSKSSGISAPEPAASSGSAPAGRSLVIRRFFPYALIAGAVALYYWPVLSAQGWLWDDFPAQNFLYRLFAAVNLKQGVLPFWNPYVFSGMPFFADIQAAVLYPLNVLLTPFAGSEWLSPLLVEYQIVLHIVLAGVFMFWLCRDLGCMRSASLLGAVTFMFCGFCTSHIFHANMIETAIWLPLIFMLFRRMVERRSLLYGALCTLTLATAFLAGHPQLMVHSYYVLGAYTLFQFFVRSKEQRLTVRTKGFQAALFVAVVALSIGISSVQLLPSNELQQNSSRASLKFTESCEGSLRPYRFITLLVPNFFGTPNTAYWGISASDVRPGSHLYWETAAYCGILPLLLALFAACFVRTPAAMFFSLTAAIALLLSMGDSLFFYKLVYTFLPGLNRFKIPGRFAFLFSFSVSILSAFGLQAFVNSIWHGKEKQRALLLRIAAGFSLAAIVGALAVSAGMLKSGIADFLLASGAFGNNAAAIARHVEKVIYPALTGTCWLFAVISVAAGTLVALRLAGRIGGRLTAAGAVSIALLDMLFYGYGYAAAPENPEDMYQKTPLVRELQEQLHTEFFRVNSRDSKPGTTDLGGRHMLFQKNQGSVHRLFLMEGYNPLRLRRQITERNQHSLDILNVKYTLRVDESAGRMDLALNPAFLPRARMVYGYRVIAAADSICPVLWSSAFNHVKTVILERKPGVASCDSCDTVAWRAAVTRYGLNAIDLDVETAREGLLVLSEIHYPCWKASVDGRPAPLHRADYALRAIEVPPGRHAVTCYYDDETFRKGRNLSLLSLFATLGFLGIGAGRRGRKRAAMKNAVG